ncbi:MAG: hypothetical protein Q7T64_00185 [Lacisediminimonas sp.]|nr:hypothetical protein [Lacisediminimonas sp.]
MMAPPNNSNHDTALRHAPAETSHTTMAAATGIVMMLSPKKVMSCQAIMEEVKNRQMEGRRNTVDWAGVAAVQRLRSLQRISAGLPLRLCKPVQVPVAGRCVVSSICERHPVLCGVHSIGATARLPRVSVMN